MSIIHTIENLLKQNNILEVVKINKGNSIPLEKNEDEKISEIINQYIDVATFYVAPIKKLKNIKDMQEFMHNIIPKDLTPTEILDFKYDEKTTKDSHGIQIIDRNYTPSQIIFGKIHYIEKIGTLTTQTIRILHDEELLKKYEEKKNLADIKHIYRRVTINPFPNKDLIIDLNAYSNKIKLIESQRDKHLQYDYAIDISELK